MEYNLKTPTKIQEGRWNEKTCVVRTAGFALDTTKIPADMEYLPKGTPIALNNEGMAVICKTAKVKEAASSGATTIKVFKGHYFKAGDHIANSTISAVNTGNAEYDTLTVSALGSALAANAVVTDNNAANVIGLAYATVKIDAAPSVSATMQAYEIEEDSLPFPVNDAIKAALTSRHLFV